MDTASPASEPEHGHTHIHSHVAAAAKPGYLWLALVLLLAFMGVEVVVGVLASSLVLISDAGHMLTDVLALALSLLIARLVTRTPGGRLTFGLRRLEVIGAQVNGVTLLLAASWFIFEAVHRLIAPPAVDGLAVAVVALVGIPVNIAAVWAVARANRRSLNVEGSFQHMLTDLYAFIATAVAGGLILWTGFNRLDALAALLVAGLMLKAAFGLLIDTGRIVLQAAPRDLDPDRIGRAMSEHPKVLAVRDLHLWEVTPDFPTLSAHVLVTAEADCHAVRHELEHLLADEYGLAHTTLQMGHADGPDAEGDGDTDASTWACPRAS